jgi:hypothetical protein
MPTATQAYADHRFNLSLSGWVTRLVDRFPQFDEYDLVGMIEEKTGVPVDRGGFENIRALYLRAKLRAWTPDVDDPEE